jgi:hypothetical protein
MNGTKYGVYELHEDAQGVEQKKLIKEYADLTEAYDKRDELQAASLAAGLNLHRRRYGVRLT